MGHRRAGLKNENIVGPRVVNGLDVVGYGQSGLKKSWTVPSLTSTSPENIYNEVTRIIIDGGECSTY